MLASIPAYAKAVIAALIAGLGSAQQALDDGAITGQEWVAVAVAALLGLGVVAAVPNKEQAGDQVRETLVPPRSTGDYRDVGAGELTLVLVCAAVSIVVLAVYVRFVQN